MTQLIQDAYFSDSILKKSSHFHDCHQIILITSGEVQFCINDKIYQAGSGNILIFSRYENHAIKVLSDEYKRYVLFLSPEATGIQSRVHSLLYNRPAGFCNAVDVSKMCSQFENLLRRIIEESVLPQKLTEDMQQLLINELLIMIYRQLPDTLDFDEVIHSIQRQFENNYEYQYTLSELAKQHNISISSLSHRFKNLTGVSVMEYLLSCRLASSKRYLTQTEFDIGEIVEKCGFSDSSNFSRTFKQRNGISPSDFRAKYKTD